MLKHQSSPTLRLALILLTTACGAPININKEGVTPIVVYPPTAAPVIAQANQSAADEIATPVMFVTAVAFATVTLPTATAVPPPASATPKSASVAAAATATPRPTAPKSTTEATNVLAGLPTAPSPALTKGLPTPVNLREVAKPPPTPTVVTGQFPKVVAGLENAVGGPNAVDIAAMRVNLLAQSNAARLAGGLPMLQTSPALQLAAQQHSDECAALRWCGHTGADGSNTRQRLQRVGYMSDAVGENWAWARSVPAAWDMWFTQEPPNGPHRGNIMSRFYREVGFGITASNGGFYFITNFGGSYR
ncbi:MAG: CAP domain-containing protein [Anaerolineae bacterium]|nr:CAP domain-containing protein [Anaerolineae bacterium]